MSAQMKGNTTGFDKLRCENLVKIWNFFSKSKSEVKAFEFI